MQTTEPNDSELSNNKIFELMDARFSKKFVLYDHLHNSYNDLINQIINYLQSNDNYFDENRIGDVIYRYRFKFENLFVRPPLNSNGDSLMYPMDARDRNTTYSIKILARITQIQEIYDLTKKEITSIKIIGTPVERETITILPCMVRSKYCSLEINRDYAKRDCEYDPGGYFIVSGSEKIVLSIERMVENKPLVFIKKDAGISTYLVKINSKSPNPNIMMQGIEIRFEKNYDIIIKVPILNEVSVFVLMRALGLETDKEIIKYIMYNDNYIVMLNLLKISIDLSKKENKRLILTKEDAYYSLTNKLRVVKKYTDKDKKLQYDEKKEHLESLLRNAFLPHINTSHHSDILKTKAYYLGYMINRLLNCYLGRTDVDDRDSFVNKRIDMPGDLIFDLFKQHYKKMLNDCNKFFKKRSGANHENPLNIINQIKPSNIELGIKSAMMTGNWGKKKGVAQMYPRLTFLQSLSFLRRIDAPSTDATTSKLTGPRHYHPSQTGFLCLTGDTEILMGDGTVKLIKDVKNGDSVVTIDIKTMKEITSPIKNWFKQDCNKLLKVTTISGRVIKCTPDHKLLTKVGDKYDYIEISKLSVGDNLIEYKNYLLSEIKLIEEIPPEPVYDFETEFNTHNFVASSLISHNCVVESPEHSNIGLVKHLSLLGSVTIGSSEQSLLIYNMIKDNKYFIHLDNHSSLYLSTMTKVFLSGEWIGLTDKPNELYKELRLLKQNGIILRTNGITYDIQKGELKIYTESGRLYRPLLNVKDNKILLTDTIINDIIKDKNLEKLNKWDALITKYPETIDYIDMEEQYYALVSDYKDKILDMKKRDTIVYPDKPEPIINRYDNSMVMRYTHCEFHPTMILGIIAGNIPFANHNFGTRNIFQYANQKQSKLLFQ
jgi:DNA-directed RNA polymerase II subunit RPB2